ncbi:hypothetical protein [Lacinutrix sp. Bg11-31]|uniref:hypothetical protein n=1 Tax=Lacinutrix sp. Bg11-31 TaxID=2057808 RepID=UPI000C3144A8|nr:hypothetical protein [Lacinutrix sp. Bg11-31]AUC80928.1 hypothetical protein CW733_01780 [Lacinutrix sp. Bg11-31]
MNKALKITYLLCLAFFSFTSVNAQELEIKKDSSTIDVTYFKENIKERYTGNDFNYSINDTGGVNLIQSVLKKFFGWLQDIFGIDIDVNYKFLEYIVYALLGVGALFLLIRFLMQTPISNVFKNESRTIDSIYFTEDTLTETNFDKLTKKAIKKGDYRLATRYLYLKSLQQLSKKEIIKWNFDKTNSEYLTEIKNKNTKDLFKRASYIYDYVWYGEFSINEDNFNQNQALFNQLNNATNG